VKPNLGGDQQKQEFQFFDGVIPQSKIEDIGALRVQFEAFWKGLFYLCDNVSSGRDSHLEFQEVFQESFSEIFSFTPSTLGEEKRRYDPEEVVKMLHRLAGRKGVQGKWEEAASYSGYAYQIGRSLDENQMKLTHATVPTFLTYALSLAKLRVTQVDKSVITEALDTGQKFQETIEQAMGHVEDDEKANQVLSEVKVRMQLLRKALKDLESEGRDKKK